ncbi:MAG: hypothetical protein SFV51_22520 [Bryobacteraceae bacterium]|nr:hypothetical protein [Bryobacteraceae bacterium]
MFDHLRLTIALVLTALATMAETPRRPAERESRPVRREAERGPGREAESGRTAERKAESKGVERQAEQGRRADRNAEAFGFTSARSFELHYEKHRAEFGNISRAEYGRLAESLRDAPVNARYLRDVRGDRTISRFDKESGHFGVYTADGKVITFFKPERGMSYYERQLRARR